MLAYLLVAQQTGCDRKGTATMSKAQDYIEAFRRGEDFRPPAVGVFTDGQPDEAALVLLGTELANGGPNVRENVVKLLVDMGRQTDQLTPLGADTLRHPRILSLLASSALNKPDLGREAAMDALRKLATKRDLARFGGVITKALLDAPSEEAFLLVAKTKPDNAREPVERLALSPDWKDVDAAKIARAALGATEIEDQFLVALDNAVDGKSLARSVGPLALIGTPRSLKAIAEHLRTPLTIDVPGRFEKSARLNVLDALLYNFPDQPVLYPNNIVTDANYAAAERFCIETLGVTYKQPRPPFLTYRGYPIMS
jgi:GrpB-like predicted nucleotidyltransferase (UPF0157 family)